MLSGRKPAGSTRDRPALVSGLPWSQAYLSLRPASITAAPNYRRLELDLPRVVPGCLMLGLADRGHAREDAVIRHPDKKLYVNALETQSGNRWSPSAPQSVPDRLNQADQENSRPLQRQQ